MIGTKKDKVDTQKIVKEKIELIKKEDNNVKEKLKVYSKISRLNKRVKFVLQMESHYSFRQHLLMKCQEYGCEIKEVSEEYTSMCCTKCGVLSKTYTNRRKKCINCNYEIDRDTSGSRNILLKTGVDRLLPLRRKAETT